MSLTKKEKEFATEDGRTFLFRRPGRGGIRRIARRLAIELGGGGGFNPIADALDTLDGRGLNMEALLQEYLVEAPWKKLDPPPDAPDSADRDWDFEEVDAAEFAAVGEEVLVFHESFREVDSRFGGQRRSAS